MRSGFNLVKISSHLMAFSHEDFTKYFVGVEAYTSQDVVNCILYKSDNDIEIVQESFKKVLEQAIFKLAEKKHSNLIEFVKFISGSSVLQPTRKLIIIPCVTGVGEVPFWPEYPLPKAQTCFNTLLMPYLLDTINDDHDIDDDMNDENTNGEEINKETVKKDKTLRMEDNGRIKLIGKDEEGETKRKTKHMWTVDCVLRNLELMLLFNKEAFSD